MKRNSRRCVACDALRAHALPLTVCAAQVAADLVSKLPYILPPVGVLILTLLGFAVFM